MTQQHSPTSGLVLNYQSNFYTVKVGDLTYQCFLKGLLKKEGHDVLVGDRVVVDSLDTGNLSGRITQVIPRDTQLSRPKVANITVAVIVASVTNPPLDLEQVNRYLTHVRLAGIKSVLCLSKTDLDEEPEILDKTASLYESLSIPVYLTSIQLPQTVRKLVSDLKGETVVLAGQSGVGKSSLLNAYHPGLSLAVGDVSEKLGRGQHTTRHAALIALDDKTLVADTPGFSYLKFDTTSPQGIEQVFSEFEPFRKECRFDNCLHMDETDCAVKANLAQIHESRYASYRAFQEEAKAYVETVQTTSQKQEYGYKTLKRGREKELQILKLKEKQREASRRTQKQRIPDWDMEDDTLEE